MKKKVVKNRTDIPVRINIYLWESDLYALNRLVEMYSEEIGTKVNRSLLLRTLIHDKFISFGFTGRKK